MPVETAIHNAYMSARSSMAKMLSRLVPPKEVDDILQDTYVRLCQARTTSHIKEPKSFLFKTAKNLAYDHLKRCDTRMVDDSVEAANALESAVNGIDDEPRHNTATQQEFKQFCDAVRVLPKQCRRAFVLKKVYGYSLKEIAKELGISEKTVEKHIAEGIKRCTLFMRKQTEDSSRLNTFQGSAPVKGNSHE
ncbi:sigma-70 family RNA polymerase sigma factor [Alteromonas sp. CI.11.F.A3]|uniref:sigma-70 family RNA polymerase sigma factor n=1 Tax=Alteromonas sp. CI.11.F.A3 TaxID=3079555 RepID=UPI002942C523|nr:sigma-70 family RNA polymerase sigma factor [Alteromonas sp. CI.11.F.A3]WOI37758.1 sigma-70 family RNA polymerase sigma factor [Alteromonas sp. CI.11.F.A3]